MNIKFIRGDNHQVRFKFKTYNGKIDKMYFTVKCSLGLVKIQKNLDKGIEYENGYYTINFVPKDTDGLTCTTMRYDIEIIVNGEKYTIQKGIFELEEDITTPNEED